jgi:hypothetical protein
MQFVFYGAHAGSESRAPNARSCSMRCAGMCWPKGDLVGVFRKWGRRRLVSREESPLVAINVTGIFCFTD